MIMEITRNDFTESFLLLKVHGLYKEGMGQDELYDITRGWWVLSLPRAEKIQYAASVVSGIILEVFRIDCWEKAKESDRGISEKKNKNRYGFIGNVADDAIRKKYVGKSVAGLYKRGNQSAVMYIEPDGARKGDVRG